MELRSAHTLALWPARRAHVPLTAFVQPRTPQQTPASLQPFLVRHRSRHLANLTHVKLTLRAKHVITWIPILLASISLATLPRVVVYILGLHYFRSVLGLPHCRGKFLESYRTAVVNF